MDLAQRYYAAQVVTVTALLALLGRLWSRLDSERLDDSWPAVRELMVLAVALAQARSVTTAAAYVPAAVRQDSLTPSSALLLRPQSWGGRTMDGRPLADVLDVAVIRVKVALAPPPLINDDGTIVPLQPASPAQAMRTGLNVVRLVAATEVQDSGREAVTAEMVTEPQIVGYERYVNTPCCGRCLILAGRVYPKSSGFLRHPRCDCAHRPLTTIGRELVARDGAAQNPRGLFTEMTREQQDRAFGQAAAEKVRRGGSVIAAGNQWRGTPSAPRPAGGNAARPGSLLTPAQIRERAGADPDEFLRLLRQNALAA